ncbi:acyl-CoA dehydrogenase family member 10-like isoform X2 [Denticeps clupeoides]|uniref:acyl-CoA dehydrogenase family member 10-like isoform X2 n=1 Tax=Denticeps clupeoides TaxID=299321 RepID=UPI0010A3599B|nr:acyl-CoA dehydrogenase family member 10-like isoform X2 [Denticeps clupeoides]
MLSYGEMAMYLSRLTVRLAGGNSHRRSFCFHPGSSYKAVVFDMYGVLIPPPMPAATEWEGRNGVPPGTIARAIRMGGEGGVWRRFMRGELGAEEFVETFSHECTAVAGFPIKVDFSSFLQALTCGPFTRLHPVMEEAIQCIRAQGMKAALLTNNFLLPGGASFLPVNRSHFHVIVESCREGLCKPDPQIFRLCADRLGVAPHEAVFLDDLDVNIDAAVRLGMCGIKVGDPAVSVKKLEQILQFPLSVGETHSIRRNQQVETLTQYLRKAGHLSDTDDLTLCQFSHCHSHPSYILKSQGSRLILRTTPHVQAALMEQSIMKALKEARVPVPDIIAVCEDDCLLGKPFIVEQLCEGRIFQDPFLPSVSQEEKTLMYRSILQTLSCIHQLEPNTIAFSDHAVQGPLPLKEDLMRSIQQYKASKTLAIPAMERLVEWLPLHLPKEHKTTVVHGDFRISNIVFDSTQPKVAAVLGWKQCILGDPFLDVASLCIEYYLSSNSHDLSGKGQPYMCQKVIPDVRQIFDEHGRVLGLHAVPHWQFYMTLSCFRQAVSTLTGENELSKLGNMKDLTVQLADLAWDFATKEGFRLFKNMSRPSPSAFPL